MPNKVKRFLDIEKDYIEGFLRDINILGSVNDSDQLVINVVPREKTLFRRRENTIGVRWGRILAIGIFSKILEIAGVREMER